MRGKWQFLFLALFALVCFLSSHRLSRQRLLAISELSFRVQELKKERMRALEERDDLTLRLQSESDPAWIELMLMKELGMVPEGWIKIRFSKHIQKN